MAKRKKKATKKTKKKATKKAARPSAINLNTLYSQVARRADTDGLQINVAETKRVLACFFDVLEDQSPRTAFDLISKGMKRAGERRR